MDDVNIHSGHRKRLKERFSKYPASLNDHELLELMLFFVLPRRDTNPLAHNLLRYCGGSLKKLAETDETALRCVAGVGEETARFIRAAAEFASRVGADRTKKAKFEYNAVKYQLIDRYEDASDETMWLFLMDAKGYILAEIPYDGTGDKIELSVGDIVQMISVHKPAGAALAHNHLSGNPAPTRADDETTAKINAMFSVHGIRLIDHIIVAGRNTYSYHYAGRLAALKHD